MKKREILMILIFLFVEFFFLANFTKAYYSRLNNFQTDKEKYYFNEEIKINASWELNYNTNTEIAFVQVQIFNISNKIIWNSTEFNENGNFEEFWILDFNDLNLSLTNYSNIFFIRFYSYYFQLDSTNTIFTFLETIRIKVIKRELGCQLTGFEEILKYGEDLRFEAKFYDNSTTEHKLDQINQTIHFEIMFNNLSIYQYNYTTNKTGMISIFLSSIPHLKLGSNKLIFTLTNNIIFNDSKFIYYVLVEKNPVFIDIMSFKDSLTKNEDLEISLFYYSTFNQTIKPLINRSIKLQIFENGTLKFIDEYRTDNLGTLYINLAHNIFNFDQKKGVFLINLKFNGSKLLKNKTLNLKLNITETNYSNTRNSLTFNILPISIVLIIISIILSFFFINNKRKGVTPAKELIFRY